MNALTPFPDGVGYMDYAWRGLSPVQRAVLRYKAGRGDPSGTARAATYLVLVQRGLLDAHDRTVTARGQALLDWAEPPPLAARAEPTRPDGPGVAGLAGDVPIPDTWRAQLVTMLDPDARLNTGDTPPTALEGP